MSREATKERLTEAISETLAEFGEEDESLTRAVADEVWSLLTELDDEDDLGILKLKPEEDLEDGG